MLKDEIEKVVASLLARYSPPRSIATNQQAMADEARLITAAVARFAPRAGFPEWWSQVGDEIARHMTTRAWPLVSEVEAACRGVTEANRSNSSASQGAGEEAAVDRMESWFRRHNDETPGMGRPSRTVALIKRGVLRDLRHARDRGFTLTSEQLEKAKDMPPGPEELRNHNRILEKLRAIQERMAPNRDETTARRATTEPKAEDA